MISASPTILAVETNSAWAVVLVVSFVTLATVLMLRRLIDRPGGLAAGILLTLPLILPLAAAVLYAGSVLPEIGVLRPASSALLRQGPGDGLHHLVLMPDSRPNVVVPYALTGTVSSWIVVVGIVASSVMLLRRLAGAIAMRRVVTRCTPIELSDSGALGTTVEALAVAAGMRRAPRLFILPGSVHGAFARGAHGGQILISRDLIDDLESEELEAILAHEIAHLQARDTVLSFVAGLARDLVAWNPLAHVALSRLLADREIEADRRAAELTGRPLAVASGLVKMCDLMRRRGLQALRPSVLLAFTSTRRPIGRRVSRLLALADGGSPSMDTRTWFPFVAAAALAAALALQSAVTLVSNDEAVALVWGAPRAEGRSDVWSAPHRPWSKATLLRNSPAAGARVKAAVKREGKHMPLAVLYQELKSAQAVAERDLRTWMRAVGIARWDAHGWDVRPIFSSTEGSFGVYKLEQMPLSPRGAL